MSTTLVSSTVGMAAGLVQVGVVTELGLDASVLAKRKRVNKTFYCVLWSVFMQKRLLNFCSIGEDKHAKCKSLTTYSESMWR